MLKLKRVYDPPSKDDGYRVLIDRLWPRGLTKEKAALDLWLKDISPSPNLRKWFGHEPERFTEFSHLYEKELETNPAVDRLDQLVKLHKNISLVYGAKDPLVNHAVVLKNWYEKR